jgi:hypothetical protein
MTGRDRDETARDEERRRRRAEVFGEVLPESTRDDRDEEPDERSRGGDAHDAELRRNVPPHHG